MMRSMVNTVAALVAMAQFASFVVVGQAPAASSPVTPSTAGAPKIQFRETSFNFGKIKASDVVRHEYIFTNTGNAVLEITAVDPGCRGCTTALPWDRQVQPGKTGRIPIQFNPAGMSSTVSKSVTVTCNDATHPTQSLQFQATIWQPIEVQPAYVYFLPAEGEESSETKVVKIVNNLEEPLTLQPPKSDNPALKLELRTVQPGKEFALNVSYSGVVTNQSPSGPITIATSSTNMPVIRITATVMPQPALAVSPPQIQIPTTSFSVGHRTTQVIRNNGSAPMKVTEAFVNAEGVTVQINESQPGKTFLLNVSFPPNFKLDPGNPIALTVKTTHPRRPSLTVPIMAVEVPKYGQPVPVKAIPPSK